MARVRAGLRHPCRRLTVAVGGRRRRRVVVLLAAVLALNSADAGTVGAVAPQLKSALGISNTRLGLLLSASLAVGAVSALPVGVLADRIARVPVLAGSIVLWTAAMAAGGAAVSYDMLLVSRVALGAVAATSGPTLASLVGDLFPPGERARIYGFVLVGELLGAGAGLIAGSVLSGLVSWRAAFWLLAAVGLGLAWLVWRQLAEPERGGQSRMEPQTRPHDRHGRQPGRSGRDARQVVVSRRVAPAAERVLTGDPAAMPAWRAARYVLSVPTAVLLIMASSLGYFFFAGLRAFSLLFVERRYGVAQAEVSLLVPLLGAGAVAGTLAGGRLADRLVRAGRAEARVTVPAVAFALTALLFVPGLLTTSALVALPLFALAAGTLAAANPPLDAARLDIMHFRLWGRAESVRTFLRTAAEATGPLVFGFVSDLLGGEVGGRGQGRALDYTFLVMLVPLLGNAALLLPARHTYPRDVATVLASERRTR